MSASHPADEAAALACSHIDTYREGLTGFADTLHSCYTKFDNSLSADLLTKVCRNVVLYKGLHLAASKEFVYQLGDFMRNYSDLDFDTFCDTLDDIAEDSRKYKEQAEFVADLHRRLEEDTRDLVDEAEKRSKMLKLEHREHSDTAQRFEQKASRHEKKATRGAFAAVVAVVGSIALAPATGGASLLGLLPAAAASDYEDHHKAKQVTSIGSSFAAQQDAEQAARVAELIAGPMRDCLILFSNAINKVCQFFNFIHVEIQKHADSATAAEAIGKFLDEHKGRLKRHFKKMQQPALKLSATCDLFLRVVPHIDGELTRLTNNNNAHQPYIQAWLERHEEQLRLQDAGGLGNTQSLSVPPSRWQICSTWCPLIRPKVHNFWVKVVMDNHAGAGRITQELTLRQVINMTAEWSQQRVKHNSVEKERTYGGGFQIDVPYIQGASLNANAATALKRTVEEWDTAHAAEQKRYHKALGQSVRLEAEAGQACVYILHVQLRGDSANVNVKAIPYNGRKLV